MSKSLQLTIRIRRMSTWLVHVTILSLVVLGIMNVVNNLTFREPSDGATWAMRDDKLTVTNIIGDLEEPQLEIGDALISINDQQIDSDTQRQDYLYKYGMDSSRPLLYRVLRGGHSYDYWVFISKLRQGDNFRFYLYVLSGFVYLVFLLLLLLQDIRVSTRLSLAFFSFCVFLRFVFRATDRFATLDWIALFLDRIGGLLLPSALASVAIVVALERSRWRNFAQAIHWVPTTILAGWSLWLVVMTEVTLEYSHLMADMTQVQGLWSGILISLSVVVLGLVAELRAKQKNLTVFWAIAWLPMAVDALGLDYPYAVVLSGALPIILPLAFLSEWSRSGRLYLGSLAKKVIIYFTVVMVLLSGYALFIILFQTLLQARLSNAANGAVLGMAIMFAAVTYGPLSHFFAELLDRLIYGKRYTSIREFSDLTEINRADTNIDDFLFTILNRIKKAFRVVGGNAYKVGENAKIFDTIVPIADQVTLVFEELKPELLQGKLVRGHEVKAHVVGADGVNPFLPNDYILPIRDSGQLAALVVFTPQGNDLKLSPEEERLLRTVLRQCDVLMENMELYHAVNQKVNSINQLKEYNENIIESSRIGILTTDEMHRAVSCNSAFSELASTPKNEIMGQTFDALFPNSQVRNSRQTRSGFLLEGGFTNRKGEELDLEIQRTPLRTRENEVYGTLYLVEDVQEKKKFNEQIMQQEKLASIGLLAAGVAHEINTPLTGIASYSQLLMGDPNLNEDQKELLDLIQGQSRRAAKIVNELLNFSRKGSGPKTPVDLLSVLNQTLRFLGHQIQMRRVRVTVNEPAEPALTIGHDNQIQQVFVNLIVNAMDAMPEGGELAVHFTRRPTLVEMTFSDSGVGMDAETRNSIFDPFFTTKEVGRGTGLGLAVVYNILSDHGASAEVASRPGKGTDFTLLFPRAPEGTVAVPSPTGIRGLSDPPNPQPPN